MTRNFLLTFVSLLFSTSVLASATHPQTFFQAEEDEQIFQVFLNGTVGEFKAENNPLLKSHGFSSLFFYEQGLSEKFSFELGTGFNYSVSESRGETDTIAGHTDLLFGLNGFESFGQFRLRYGFNARISPGASTPDNSYSGRNDIAPFIGFDYDLDHSFFGMVVAHTLLIGKQRFETSTGFERKATGASDTSLSAFYEYKLRDHLLGALVSFTQTSDREFEDGSRSQFIDQIQVQYFASLKMSEDLTLVPNLVYTTTPESEFSGIQIEKLYTISGLLEVRYSF